MRLLLMDRDFIRRVDFTESDNDLLGLGRRNVLSDKIWSNREFPVASVNQDSELDVIRTTMVDKRVHCGTNCSTGLEDVVDEDDRLSINIMG